MHDHGNPLGVELGLLEFSGQGDADKNLDGHDRHRPDRWDIHDQREQHPDDTVVKQLHDAERRNSSVEGPRKFYHNIDQFFVGGK